MKKFMLLLLVCCTLFFLAQPVAAGDRQLVFGWQQDISPDFGGWNLYASQTAGGPYTEDNIITAILYGGVEQTEYTSSVVFSSPDGQSVTWFFVMTAYDNNGNESVFSNEVSTVIDFESPGVPFNLIIEVVRGE